MFTTHRLPDGSLIHEHVDDGCLLRPMNNSISKWAVRQLWTKWREKNAKKSISNMYFGIRISYNNEENINAVEMRVYNMYVHLWT